MTVNILKNSMAQLDKVSAGDGTMINTFQFGLEWRLRSVGRDKVSSQEARVMVLVLGNFDGERSLIKVKSHRSITKVASRPLSPSGGYSGE